MPNVSSHTAPPKTFIFARERLVTRTIPKDVILKGEYNSSTTAATFQTAIRDKLAVSPSGRTLSDILCLSCPDLSKYTVTSVRALLWGKVVVTYSRPESMSEADRLRQMEVLQQELVTARAKLQRKLEEEELLARWQTANLVIHAFAPFVWTHVSNVDKAELSQHGIENFLDLYHVKQRYVEGSGRHVARRVYRTIDVNVRKLAERFMDERYHASRGRYPLAHPDISDAGVRKFLEDLELGDSPLVQAAVNHINLTANNQSNIQETNRG